MKPPSIPLAHILELAPPCYRISTPDTWADRNGHMNMRHFVAVFDDAGDELYLTIGLDPAFHAAHHSTTFDLEHHTHFLREVKIGDVVAVYVRPIARSSRRIHYLMFLVNETQESLACIFECVNSFVDLASRRTAPYPPDLAARLDQWIAAYADLTWAAPVSGVMGA